MSIPVPALPPARRPSRSAGLWLLALGALGATWALPATGLAQHRTSLRNQESPLADVPYGPETLAAVVSTDGSRAVVVGRAGDHGEQVIVQDGHRAAAYLALAKGTPLLNADGKHCAYAGSRESQLLGENLWWVVYDGAEQGPFYFIQPDSLAFRPDGTFLACVVRRRDGKEAVCVLSEDPPAPQAPAQAAAQPPARPPALPPAPAPAPGAAAPAPGGAEPAADAPPAVVHQEMGRWYDRVGDHAPRFSPDGSYLAYAAFRDGHWRVLFNGEEGGAYDAVGPTRFCASGVAAAYVGRREGKAVAVTVSLTAGARAGLGAEGPAQDEIRDNSLTFSSSGTHLAYVVGKPGARRVLADGGEVRPDNGAAAAGGPGGAGGEPFKEVAEDSLSYSDDELHLAFAASRGGRWFVVRDGVEGPGYAGLAPGAPVFGPGGKRLAYVAERVAAGGGGRERIERFVVVDGVPQKPYDRIPAAPVFSADGKRCAYVAERGGQCFAVVDGMEGKPYPCIRGGPVLNADGSRCAFAALPPDTEGRFSAAEEVVRDPTDPSAGSRLLFDRAPSFRRLLDEAKKQPVKLVLVEERVVEE